MKLLRPTALSVLPALLAAALAAATTGCVEEVGNDGLIDRTQANYIRKADLHGVWYEIAVVSDMPANAGFGFVGQQNFGGEDGKLLFDIQENWLVAYPFTERVLGADAKWTKRKIRTYWRAGHEHEFIDLVLGNPVAMYPIVSHFDRIRNFNKSTGAQTNELTENSSLNAWWKRKYIRVDWMGNALMNVMFPQGSMKYSPVDHYVQEHDGDDPNRFYMHRAGKEKAVDYFHFTRRMFGQPMSTGACSTYSLAPGDCSGAQFDVRVAYRRVSPKRVNDYEIRPYHNRDAADKFGFFLADRYRYDEDYGLTYSGHDYKAQRWNIWEHSKNFTATKDAAGKETRCLTNRDCAAPAVCDQADWFAMDPDGRPAGKCSTGARIEYTQRGTRPIIYHLSADHPANHIAAEYDTADSWNDVFRDMVSWLWFWEAKWGKGFADGQSRFGERFCKVNADCSAHAAAQGTVAFKSIKSNRLIVGAGKDGKGEVTVLDDAPDARPKLAGTAWVAFLNATPGSAAASLDIGGLAKIDGAKYAAGVVKAADQGTVVKPSSKSVELTVTAGAVSVKLPNVKLASGDVVHVVYFGGDQIAVLHSAVGKVGARILHGVAARQGKTSEGDALEVGINGTRKADALEYGQATDFLATFGDTQHVVFLKSGDRADVSCRSVDGVGTCVGWRQMLTAADYKQREDLKATVPHIFVLCENVYTRSLKSCSADERGNFSTYNDCRYWTKKKVNGKEVDHNPCTDTADGGFVSDAAKPKIIGDGRYNFLYWVTQTNASSPLGYGPSAGDPDTGETIWATANVYGSAMVTYAQYAKDLVDLLNGDLDPKDVASGKYIRDYINQQSTTAKDKSLWGAALPAGAGADEETDTEALERAKSESTLRLADLARGAGLLPLEADKLVHDLENPKNLQKVLDKAIPSFDIKQVYAQFDKLKGTSVERALINDEVALVMSEGAVQPGEQIGPELLGKISPLGWATPKRAIDEKRRLQLLGIHSITPAEFEDASLLGLAKRMRCQPGQTPTDKYAGSDTKVFDKACYKGDALRTALSVALFRGVMEHEVGHTVGLRHNFEASMDLLNYFDPYFDPDKGREKEAVVCGQLNAPSGVVSADSFCLNDEFGEKCVLKACTADAECPGGAKCAKTKCVDQDGSQVGTCHGKTPFTVACTSDAACGDGAFCKGGLCHEKVACKDDAACTDGQLCQGGFCAAALTGQFAGTLVEQESKLEELKKYVPRPHMTAKEIDNRRTEYQYSTVMDYGQRVHADVWGLGKYDYAAIKYGYGEMLEVYADTSYLTKQTRRYAKNQGTSFENVSWKQDTADWQWGGRVTTSLAYPNDWMPPELNKKRESVPAQYLEQEMDNNQHYGRGDADKTFFEVPYKYCSDEYAGNLGCYRFDMGSSPEEIVFHSGEMLNEYYLFDAFKRERLWFARGGSPAGYMARIQDRWLGPMADAGRFYALFNNIYRVYGWWDQFDNGLFGLYPLKRASEDAFKRFTASITSPAPGCYAFDKDSNTYTNVSYEVGAAGCEAGANVPIGLGKFPWTAFATKKGYYYYDHPKVIGSYWEKAASIGMMTNSTANFLTDYVGEQLPLFRGTAIGFNTIYPKQLADVLGGMAAGDVQRIGGTFHPTTKQFIPYNPFKPAPATQARVVPSVMNPSLRLMASVEAIANLPAGFDPSYTDSMAVWLKGSGGQYTFGQGKVGGAETKLEVAEFEDPWGKKTYVAPKPNYTSDQYSPTYETLRKLNKLKSGCASGSTCQDGLCSDGVACAKTWLSKATGAEREVIANTIKKEMELVDQFRNLYGIYGSIGLN
ncbi:MAG: hypothetical protein EXR79_08305 [Myxococcales bacterium]|nr:hypothetical protein [Myxococcales bacterium]